jgi:hypothetical protein
LRCIAPTRELATGKEEPKADNDHRANSDLLFFRPRSSPLEVIAEQFPQGIGKGFLKE